MKLFISYRRSDSQHFAGRLAERLRQVRGISEIFFDIDSIGIGEDFARHIHDSISQCAAALVIIGREWDLSRLADETDIVRLEVREALRSTSRVLPVLVDNARMPAPEQLPEDLRPLTSLNALLVRHDAFDRDVAALIDAVLERKPASGFRQFLRAHPALAALFDAAMGGAGALVLLVLLLAVLNTATGDSLDQLVGGPAMAILLTVVIVILGAATPWYLHRR